MFRKKTKRKGSVSFDDTNELLLSIQRLLIRESRKEKIIKIFKKSDK
jgi:hypothetical protein